MEEKDGGEDGVVVVVVVVGMEKEMKERKVEKLVEMVVELEGGWPAKEATMAVSFAGKMEKEGKYERERKKERWVNIYKGNNNYKFDFGIPYIMKPASLAN